LELSDATWWWIAAGVLVAAELTTGTFYLLMLALGCVAGALGGHAGGSATLQVVTAALVGGGATAAWHFKRASSPRSAPSDRNQDVNLDIGLPLMIDAWQPDGSATVRHRGASWTVRLADGGTPAPGPHVVVAVQGNQLRVAPAAAR
jgi:membrane protein implicated in regulation of membrane protease activity